MTTQQNMGEIVALPLPEESKEQKRRRLREAKRQELKYGKASLCSRKSLREIAEAIDKSGGITSNACKLLDCTQVEFSVVLNAYPEIGKRWSEMRKQIASSAELAMTSLLSSSSESMRFQAAKYLLDKLGASEGYGSVPQAAITVQTGDSTTTVKAIFGIE